jgi:hypothetical protein
LFKRVFLPSLKASGMVVVSEKLRYPSSKPHRLLILPVHSGFLLTPVFSLMQRNCTQFPFFHTDNIGFRAPAPCSQCFVLRQEIPQANHSININSPNFFITNFNDMKRMNLIRVALFAVFAFMGSISLSAQSWLPPATALVVYTNALNDLDAPPSSPAPSGNSVSSKQTVLGEFASSPLNCSNCALNSVKVQYLKMTIQRLKEGMDTQAAVNEVRGIMLNGMNNIPMISAIQSGYAYMGSF